MQGEALKKELRSLHIFFALMTSKFFVPLSLPMIVFMYVLILTITDVCYFHKIC